MMSVLTSTGEDSKQVHGEHRDLLVLAVLAGQLGVLAVEDEVDPAVPLLDHLAGFVDLTADGFVRPTRPSSSGAWWVGYLGPPRTKRRRSSWASAVPSLSAVAYLTSSSYCWAISGQLTVRAEVMGAIAAHGLSVPMPGA
jgi:hypothetical protein